MTLTYTKRNLLIVLVVTALILLLTPASYAFLWQGIEITPRVSLRESYDDNVTFIKDDPREDFITNLLLGFGLKQEGKTHSVTMDVNATRQFFADNTSFDNTSEAMTLRFLKDISKYDRFTVTDSFSHSEEPRSFEDAFGRTTGRYFTYYNLCGLGYSHDLNQQLTWNLRYFNDATNYTRKDLSDSTMNSAGTGLDYALNSATIMSLNYDYNKRDFDPGPSAIEQETSVNVRRFLTSQLYLDVQAGADFIESFNEKNYTRPVYRVALTNDIDENTRTGISFEKRYTTNSSTQDLFDIWRVSANYIKALTSRITAAFNAFYGSGDYVTTDINEKYTGASIGVSYDLTKKTKLNLSYAFSKNDSTVADSGYTKNVIYLGLTIQF